jgi:hypothetical protein
MSKIIPKSNLTVKHIWEAYSKELLAKHSGYYAKQKRHSKVVNFYVYRKEENLQLLVLSYPLFVRVFETFFTEARKRIIQGEAVNINNCGRILASRVERRHGGRRMINRAATKKQPLVWNEAKNKFSYAKIIYYTDDDWCRIDWLKKRIRNCSFYTFQPTDSSSSTQEIRTLGFRQEFSDALTKNKLLKFKYWYQPVTAGYKSKLLKSTKHTKTTKHGIPEHQQ